MAGTSGITGRPDTGPITDKDGIKYNAIFTDETDNGKLSSSDFMNLLMAQMQNQDFTSPMDNTQMVNQMATFANMSAIEEQTSYAKTNYAMSLIGKTVTASRYSTTGLETTTGVVSKVSLSEEDGNFIIYVGGKQYKMSQVMQAEITGVGGSGGAGDGDAVAPPSEKVFPKNFKFSAEVNGTSAELKWDVPTEDKMTAAGLKYSVYYTPFDEKNKFDTVELVEKGTAVTTLLPNAPKATVNDLQPNTAYTMNVVVTDAQGGKAVYNPVNIKSGGIGEGDDKT